MGTKCQLNLLLIQVLQDVLTDKECCESISKAQMDRCFMKDA